MTETTDGAVRRRSLGLAAVSVALLVALSAYAVAVDRGFTVVVVSWAAFLAMSVGIVLGAGQQSRNPFGFVWGYGLAGGAMITSAAIFLVPQAIGYDPKLGGAGIALGLVSGYASHAIGHRLSHVSLPIDQTTAQITAHAVAAGIVLGALYAADPQLGVVLGLAIASHKGPVGYAAGRRLSLAGRPIWPLALPAAAMGVAALAARFSGIALTASSSAVLFGFATGIFLHLGMDFLPECEVGGEIHELVTTEPDAHAHSLLDKLRLHAVAGTTVGGVVVFGAWWLL